jgi:hypothetical protein
MSILYHSPNAALPSATLSCPRCRRRVSHRTQPHLRVVPLVRSSKTMVALTDVSRAACPRRPANPLALCCRLQRHVEPPHVQRTILGTRKKPRGARPRVGSACMLHANNSHSPMTCVEKKFRVEPTCMPCLRELSACSQNRMQLLPHLIPSPLDPSWLRPIWSILWLAFDQSNHVT